MHPNYQKKFPLWELNVNSFALQINIVENGADRREPPRVVDPEGKHKARKIDKVSRKIFPVAFVLFNIVYWIMYTVPYSNILDGS